MGWTCTNRALGLELNQLLTIREQARQPRSLGRYSACARPIPAIRCVDILVGTTGIEPVVNRILNPARLPVSPDPQRDWLRVRVTLPLCSGYEPVPCLTDPHKRDLHAVGSKGIEPFSVAV